MKKAILFTAALAFNIFLSCNSYPDDKAPYQTSDTNRPMEHINSPDTGAVNNAPNPNGGID